ncbi:thymidylate synthase [Devosia enhydra]|uniref:thymidylate synthase n=1 Tax=Devosia enhydra TaxID=665118 RepID=A0A1K2HU10_9HYPH|nr:thymidylate synthase [Devosia enhydra]SFZ81805.1 thymidylate synthase [Devosia enhydra]
MEITEESLDGLLVHLYEALIQRGAMNTGSRGGTRELLGVTLRLTRPQARLSRSEDRGKPFSALGELLWYLSGSDKLEFVEPYVPRYVHDAENGTIHGAYGPRLFTMRGNINQVDSVIAFLKKTPGSRRAVIQLFNAEDIAKRYLEIPCTTTLQVLCREERLHLSVTMRSNDAYFGLPHDVFCFTMIQEMMARTLGMELGEYYHYVGSMHIYDDKLEAAAQYLEEGHQRTVEMPRMPDGSPFELVPALLSVEDMLRHGESVDAFAVAPDDYWADIVRLYQAFWAAGNDAALDALRDAVTTPIYKNYIDGRRTLRRRTFRSRETRD